MRVAVLLLEDFPGSDNRVQRQCRTLVAAGHDVTVFCAAGASKQRDWEGVRIERSSVRRLKTGSMVRRMYDYVAFPLAARRWLRLNGDRFDVVQAANPPDWLALTAGSWRKAASRRLVLDIHDPMPELLAARGRMRWLSGALRALERRSCLAADTVLVTTEQMRLRIAENTGVKAILVPNTVDQQRFPHREPDTAVFRNRPLRVVYHGTVQDRFGVDIAAEAVVAAVKKGVDVRFDVYGDGVGMARVRAVADSAPVGVVTLHGQQPSSQLPRLLDGAAVGLVPYRDSPFMRLVESTKALEYSSLGITVIGTDLPPLRSQLGDLGAIYVPSGDVEAISRAIASLAEDPERAVAFAREAQAHVGDNDWSAHEERYLLAVVGEQGGPS